MTTSSGIFRVDFDYPYSIWLYRMGMYETLRLRGVTDDEFIQLGSSLVILREVEKVISFKLSENSS